MLGFSVQNQYNGIIEGKTIKSCCQEVALADVTSIEPFLTVTVFLGRIILDLAIAKYCPGRLIASVQARNMAEILKENGQGMQSFTICVENEGGLWALAPSKL